jgi:murein DD-endopeptidase MepM/ murein hydrolase activator NlpD
MLLIAKAKAKYEPLPLAARVAISILGFILLQLSSPIQDYNYIHIYRDFSLLVAPIATKASPTVEKSEMGLEQAVKLGSHENAPLVHPLNEEHSVISLGIKSSKKLFTTLPLALAGLANKAKELDTEGLMAKANEEIAIVKVESTKLAEQAPVWPVKGKISSPFGMRFHPVVKANRFHNGIDIKAWYGTPIVAPVDGVVTTAGYNGAFGRLVKIKTETGNRTLLFGHMQRIQCKVGQRVTKGQTIGTVGSSGRSTGPHLHFGVMDASQKYINPVNFLNP